MAFYADLHVHSRHCRATSRDSDLERLASWAGRKGIGVVATGDFTHPAWFAEICEKLVPVGDSGLFHLRDDLEKERLRRLPASCQDPVQFMLSVEISTVYKQDGRTRKIHHLVYAPDLETAGRFNARLATFGNLDSDGRPILGLDSRQLLETALESGPDVYLVPAHIWTPWFAVLGARSGFDHIDDCYGDLAAHIFALETGLCSDPPMNWRVSALDRYRLVSGSDAHSPSMVGREASLFEVEPDYFAMRTALETGVGYGGTVEFFPEEGRHHLDGHRACGIRLDPSQTRAHRGTCPVCHDPLTTGVLNRVESLADRTVEERPEEAADFRSLIPLPGILGEIAGVGARSKTVEREVGGLVERLGPELRILTTVPEEDLRRGGSTLLGEAIGRLRRGHVHREGGFDGAHGRVRLFDEGELAQRDVVAPLFESAPPAPGTPSEPQGATRRKPRASGRDDGSRPRPAARRRVRSGIDPLADLDPDQRRAAEIIEGPLLIRGGPGSGKTHTMTRRMAYQVTSGSAPADEVLALHSTRRAALAVSAHLDALLAGNPGITSTTVEALGLRILHEQRALVGLHRGFRVADDVERLALVRDRFGIDHARARRLLAEIALAKRSGALDSYGPTTEANFVAAAYREALAARGWIDFDDLLVLPVDLLESNRVLRDAYRARFRWLSIDEFHDVEPLAHRLLRALTPPDGNVCVVGDPQQSICESPAGSGDLFEQFRTAYPTARRADLGRNHRATATILAASRQALTASPRGSTRSSDDGRKATKPLVLHRARNERAEARFVAEEITRLLEEPPGRPSGAREQRSAATPNPADIAILYRTPAQAEILEAALRQSGIATQRRSHDRLLERPAVRAIAARLRAREDGPGQPGAPALPFAGSIRERLDLVVREAAVADELRLPETADDAVGLAAIREAADLLFAFAEPFDDDLEAFEAALAVGREIDARDPGARAVSLLTLQAARGLEFHAVFVVGCEDGLLPLHPDDEECADGERERRLFFVGMTRAREHLFLTQARRRGRIGATEPSPYLADIAPELCEHRGSTPTRTGTAAPVQDDQLDLLEAPPRRRPTRPRRPGG